MIRRETFMENQKTKSLNSIGKPIDYREVVRVADLNTQNGKPTLCPMPPDALNDWYKTASRELSRRVYGEKFLKDLTIEELKDILEYTIDTGGFNS
jgi:hypothetical protein